jgi:hypothetical protein
MIPTLRWTRSGAVTILVVYFNLVMANVVSLRQHWYVQTYRNGTELLPLHDTLFVDWVGSTNLPAALTLRDMVDVCTWSFVVVTIVAWFLFSKKPIHPARVLSAQLLFIPMFTLAQLLTIVPDSTPNCLELFDIPSSQDIGWVFWRYPSRTCGNMLWSSDIAQLVVFTSVAVEIALQRCSHCATNVLWIFSHIWILMTMAFVFSAKYQYSVDVLSTVIIVKLAMTHPSLTQFAEHCFVRNGKYFERYLHNEMVPLTI